MWYVLMGISTVAMGIVVVWGVVQSIRHRRVVSRRLAALGPAPVIKPERRNPPSRALFRE
jgi:hypothetical protein